VSDVTHGPLVAIILLNKRIKVIMESFADILNALLLRFISKIPLDETVTKNDIED
jgi:hypothetical protein